MKNFDQIEVGDVVTAQYQEETAIFVRPSTGAPTEDATGRPCRPQGQVKSRRAVATRTNEITATVEGIDYPKSYRHAQRATRPHSGPSGSAPTWNNFDAVRKGDEVVVRHTNAVAVAVTK